MSTFPRLTLQICIGCKEAALQSLHSELLKHTATSSLFWQLQKTLASISTLLQTSC